jgi:hypothetical protein
MRLKKWSFLFSLIISTLAIIFLFININIGNEEVKNLSSSLCLGFFTSSFAVAIIYFVEYNFEKNKSLDKIVYFAGTYISDKLPQYCYNFMIFYDVKTGESIVSNDRSKLVQKLLNDTNVYNQSILMISLHRNFMIEAGSFSTFFKTRYSEEVNNLYYLFAEINFAIEWCKKAYECNQNPILAHEISDYKEKLDKSIILLQRKAENDIITKFIDSFNAIQRKHKLKTLQNTKLGE